MTRTFEPVAELQVKTTVHPMVWISAIIGMVSMSGAPIPIVNAWTLNLAVFGVLCGFVSLFLRDRSYWGLLGILMSGFGILGAIYFQHKLAADLGGLFS